MISLGVKGEGFNDADLLTGRSCIIAQSGAGKSYGVAVICEELLSKGFGFTVIDTEGEYSSLKQKFEVLTVGGSGSDLNVKGVDLSKLASRAISESIPVILDVSDVNDERGIVNDWLSSIYEAADKLRKPYLVVVEEADKFVPQRGARMNIFHEVARRGRKRGLGLLIASQRPALIDKDVLSQCSHQFIGKLTLDNDLDAVKHFFDNRKDLLSLPDLNPGEFFMIGFKPEPSLFKFHERITSHEGFTPSVTDGVSPRVREVVDFFKSDGPGVKVLVSKSDAELIASRLSRRKFLLFGKKEEITQLRLFYEPVIELSLRAPKNHLFSEEFIDGLAYLTPGLLVVDKEFRTLFDLSFMKSLSLIDLRTLLSLLYSGSRTVSDVARKESIGAEASRKSVNTLLTAGLIVHSGWVGKEMVFKSATKIIMPRVSSLFTERISVGASVNEQFVFDADLVNKVVKSLGPKASIVGSKVIYYPFYKVTFRSGDLSREMLINAVTRRIK